MRRSCPARKGGSTLTKHPRTGWTPAQLTFFCHALMWHEGETTASGRAASDLDFQAVEETDASGRLVHRRITHYVVIEVPNGGSYRFRPSKLRSLWKDFIGRPWGEIPKAYRDDSLWLEACGGAE